MSITLGLAGGPSGVSIPGPDGMLSPIRTNGWPWMATPVDAPIDPIGSVYGAPDTELTMLHNDPATASGIPAASTALCGMVVMTPLSGAPAAPGLTMTAHPTVTGGPDIITPG